MHHLHQKKRTTLDGLWHSSATSAIRAISLGHGRRCFPSLMTFLRCFVLPSFPRRYNEGMAHKRKLPAEPTVTFWGAARTVTGSMHRLDACGQSLLLDCGLFQGRRAEGATRNRAFPFRPKDIDAVVLSHAHIDHCGNLPNLVKQGFTGPVHLTPATHPT